MPTAAVQLLAQDVGVPGVPVGLGEHVDHDVEQLHVRARPPRHVAGRVDVESRDRRVRVVPDAPVAVDDLGPRLVRGGPQVGEGLEVVVPPPGQSFGKRAPEDVAEVPGLGAGEVLDQTEEVRPGGGQRPADVVLGEPVELPEHRGSHVVQVAVQVVLRERIDHGDEPST